MLTSEQIDLIRDAFERIAPRREAFAEDFYDRLFSLQPALRLLFSEDLSGQKKKLVEMLAAMIGLLDEPEKLAPLLADSGARHALYGVREEHYETVGTALLETLRATLRTRFDRETEAAWAAMYAVFSRNMIGGARALRASTAKTEDHESKIMNTYNSIKQIAFFLLISTALAGTAFAQTTVFTYQGKLNDGAAAANGSYELQFKLYDTPAVGSGAQIGGIVQTVNATATNGIFTVELDFGAAAFDGGARFLEIAVRRSAQESFATLEPRQPLTSTPYAIKARIAETAVTANNAQQLGGVAASEYVQTDDSRMSDARTPLPGSPDYIRNSASLQTTSNFNISGEGRANVLTAAQQFNIGASRVLSVAGTNNLFVGVNAGAVNTGGENTFVGRAAGAGNTTAFGNSFFGRSAGLGTTTGEQNSFFGQEAGLSNSTARYNAFFGALTGRSNTTGEGNSFFGTTAGLMNTTGTVNSFFGLDAGRANTTGGWNTFVGSAAGQDNTLGNENSFFGRAAGSNNTTGTGNTFLGRSAGVGNSVGNQNTFVGFEAGFSNPGNNNTLVGAETQTGVAGLFFATAIGAGAVVSNSNTIVLGRTNGADRVRIFGLGAVGSTPLCRNANNEISTCSSFPLAETNNGALVEKLERQQAQLEAQAKEIALLKQLVCAQNKEAAVCGQ